jgi:hypothetical protein
MSQELKGTGNVGVTGLITTRKKWGTHPASPNENDVVGPRDFSLKAAKNMGLIDGTSGTINTMSGPAAYTRVG